MANCATFHASPFGSNTPPYDTYAKAAHKVADAVLAASGYGDTVLVHTGSYNFDTTIIPVGVTWAGVGRDSVVLNWSDTQNRFGILANLSGNNEIYGLEFSYPLGSSFNEAVDGLWSFASTTLNVHDCRFLQLKVSIAGSGPLEVSNNEFLHGQTSGLKPGEGSAWIHHNSFWGTTNGEGGMCLYAGQVLIEHNVFQNDATGGRPCAVRIYHADSVTIRNNVIVNSGEPVSWFYASGSVENNTIIDAIGVPYGLPPYNNITVILRSYETVAFRNNAFLDLEVPFEFGPESPACCDTTGLITFVHNAFWPPRDSFFTTCCAGQYSWRVKFRDSANLNLFPMFTIDSSFQLQLGSPLIDAGDPAVNDLDSSRSDIGRWGGPHGSTYPYPDLPPAAPESLTYDYAFPHVTLWWRANHETDLDHYSLHRGNSPAFIPAIGNQINMTWGSDTTYTDSLQDSLAGAYYKVVAVDAIANNSAPSNEVAVIPTGVFDTDEPAARIPRSPRLVGNYPNPFNNSTVFTVTIPAVGASPAPVQIIIIDALGRQVTVAYQGSLGFGTHQIPWDGCDSLGHPLASGVYFAELKFWSLTINQSVKVVIVR
ncbi:MAG: T9SS type A sorting domain-containing protein [candidate division Zixibacteria bacterium]|nr:T9SS type A sorting domain-containing protein [candidate division Zixibacteria bacterium]